MCTVRRQRQGVLRIGRWRGSIRTLWREELCLKQPRRRERTTPLVPFFSGSSFLLSLAHVRFPPLSFLVPFSNNKFDSWTLQCCHRWILDCLDNALDNMSGTELLVPTFMNCNYEWLAHCIRVAHRAST